VLTLRQLLVQERHGMLATLSVRHGGWPFGSVVEYATRCDGAPIFLFSELAEHTRNVRADARASLLVQDSHAREEPLAGARVTLVGRLAPTSDSDATRRYLERHPQAKEYIALGDFKVWVLEPAQARFVNGFGDMGWLEGDRLRAALVAE
jgi:heme oxygenase (biliverdin-IX-beta and delta-forming)